LRVGRYLILRKLCACRQSGIEMKGKMTELICKIHAEVLDGNFDSFLAKRITVTQDSFEVHVLIGLLQKL
jgi:hypothetical protein